jgi:hypothetical protein
VFLLCGYQYCILYKDDLEDKLEGIWKEKWHNWGYMETSPGNIGENKENPQSITPFSWSRFGLDLSNWSLRFCCYNHSLSRRATQFVCTHKKGIEYHLVIKWNRQTAKFLSLNVSTSDGIILKSSGNWAEGKRRCRLMLSCNNNTQQKGKSFTLNDVMTMLWWKLNYTL